MAGIGNVHSERYGSGISGFNYCLHLNEGDAVPDVVESMRRYYWTDVLHENAHRRVLNKQPHLSNKLRYVLGIFPDAKIIHIIRDCPPVVASWIVVMGQHPSLLAYWPEERYPCFWLFPRPSNPVAASALARHGRFFPGNHPELWIDYWCKVNMGITEQMHGREDQLCVVRYEDMVRNPMEALRSLCQFAELSEFSFDVQNIEKNTAARHAHLLSESLRFRIAQRAIGVRRYFGYQRGFVWNRRNSRLID
jgi:hypothetical protein